MIIVLFMMGSILGCIFSAVQYMLGIGTFGDLVQSYFIFGWGFPMVTLLVREASTWWPALRNDGSEIISQTSNA